MRRKTDVFGTMCKVMAWTLATTALTGLGAARVDVGERAIKALWHGADVPELAATGWRARLEPWQTVVYQVEER